MEKIPAKDRFSKHAKISEVSPEILKEAMSKFGLSHEECQVRPLPGGFMNANFMVASGDRKFVFRVYSSDRVTAERERDVLQFLRSYPVKTPEPFALFEAQGRPIAVVEYIDGITLEDKILSDEPIGSRLYEEIGRQLAQSIVSTSMKPASLGLRWLSGKSMKTSVASLGGSSIRL